MSVLTKPSWLDSIKPYSLSKNKTNLEYIGKLTANDLTEIDKYLKD